MSAYNELQEQKKHDAHLEKVRQFRNRHYQTFVRLGGPDSVAAALTDYLMTMTGGDAKVFHLPNLMQSGDWYLWEMLLEYYEALEGYHNLDELDDEFLYDLTCYSHVHNLFPPLKQWVEYIYATCKGDTPSGDCYCGSVMEQADTKFATVLLKWAMKLKQALNTK